MRYKLFIGVNIMRWLTLLDSMKNKRIMVKLENVFLRPNNNAVEPTAAFSRVTGRLQVGSGKLITMEKLGDYLCLAEE